MKSLSLLPELSVMSFTRSPPRPSCDPPPPSVWRQVRSPNDSQMKTDSDSSDAAAVSFYTGIVCVHGRSVHIHKSRVDLLWDFSHHQIHLKQQTNSLELFKHHSKETKIEQHKQGFYCFGCFKHPLFELADYVSRSQSAQYVVLSSEGWRKHYLHHNRDVTTKCHQLLGRFVWDVSQS